MASKNAVLVSKQIFLDVETDDAGTSEIICLDGADKFSCQAVYDVTTPTGATVTFQASNDRVNWTAIQASTSMAVDGSTILEVPNVSYRYFRTAKAISAGDVDLQCYILVIGDAL